jgi:thiol-disulfide isomerase/thioredoxin
VIKKIILLLLTCTLFSSAFAVTKGDVAPAWSGVDLVDGAQVQFPSLLQDKPAVLIFWATWCPYCKAFMPYAEGIEADYREHGVQILTFNAKERGRGDPKAYVDSLGFPLVAIADADGIAEQYNIKFIPGLLVVGGDGVVTYRRRSTDLPAGKKVSELWDEEVRRVLDDMFAQ